MANAAKERLKRFSLEAVPNSDGQYQAVFRIHLDGALPADDDLLFGEVWDDPLSACDEARRLGEKHLNRVVTES